MDKFYFENENLKRKSKKYIILYHHKLLNKHDMSYD